MKCSMFRAKFPRFVENSVHSNFHSLLLMILCVLTLMISPAMYG
jgi:hypothetical protein